MPREQATRLVEVGIEPTAFGFMGRRSATELLSLRREKYPYQTPLGEKIEALFSPFHAASASYIGCVLTGEPDLKIWRGNKRNGVAFRHLF